MSQHFVDVRGVSIQLAGLRRWTDRWRGVPKQSVTALSDVTFQMMPGERVVVFGRPGSGKSTLLRLLTGVLRPTTGTVLVNGLKPDNASGYVSPEETEPYVDTVHQVLKGVYGQRTKSPDPHRLAEVVQMVGLGHMLSRPASLLSSTERLRLNIARAALMESPLLLLDDVADVLGADETKYILDSVFTGQTVIVATRQARVAEALDWPMMLLLNGKVAQRGTREGIARDLACRRIVDVWLEGIRYDLYRYLKQQSGVEAVTLQPTSGYLGLKLRVELTSSRHLPAFYDVVSQADVVKIDEIPPSLTDIVRKLK